MHNNVIIL